MPKVNSIAQTYKSLKKKRAFTLIELLIVITIIGILATFIVASFTTAQAKARDSRRKSDLDAIKKAMELYKGDTPGGAWYPGCHTGGGGDPATAAGPCGVRTAADTTWQSTNPATLAAYFGNNFPADPTNTGACTGTAAAGTYYAGNVGLRYCYWPQGTAGSGTTANQYPSYILTACIENGNDTGGNTYVNANANCGPKNTGANSRTYGFANP